MILRKLDRLIQILTPDTKQKVVLLVTLYVQLVRIVISISFKFYLDFLLLDILSINSRFTAKLQASLIPFCVHNAFLRWKGSHIFVDDFHSS